jgi:hypothetical protein
MTLTFLLSHPKKFEQPEGNAMDPKKDNKQYLDHLGGKETYSQKMIQ